MAEELLAASFQVRGATSTRPARPRPRSRRSSRSSRSTRGHPTRRGGGLRGRDERGDVRRPRERHLRADRRGHPHRGRRTAGPGIPDIELAMQEGWSTATDEMREMGFGFGMGLPNIRRNSDAFEIPSEVGEGTTVRSRDPARRRWLSSPTASASPTTLRRLPGLHARLPDPRDPRAARQGRAALRAVHRLRVLPGGLPERRHRRDDPAARGDRQVRVQGRGASPVLFGQFPGEVTPDHIVPACSRRLRRGLGLRRSRSSSATRAIVDYLETWEGRDR